LFVVGRSGQYGTGTCCAQRVCWRASGLLRSCVPSTDCSWSWSRQRRTTIHECRRLNMNVACLSDSGRHISSTGQRMKSISAHSLPALQQQSLLRHWFPIREYYRNGLKNVAVSKYILYFNCLFLKTAHICSQFTPWHDCHMLHWNPLEVARSVENSSRQSSTIYGSLLWRRCQIL